MAVAPITQRPRVGPLDTQRTIEMWLHIVETEGKRGSYRKVGEKFGVSDERIRQIVTAWQSTIADTAPEPLSDPLSYEPPPGHEILQAALVSAREAAQRERANDQAAEIERLCNAIGDALPELLRLSCQIAKQRSMTDTERWLHSVNLEARSLATIENERRYRQALERARLRDECLPSAKWCWLYTVAFWLVPASVLSAVPVMLQVNVWWGVGFGLLGLLMLWLASRWRVAVLKDPWAG